MVARDAISNPDPEPPARRPRGARRDDPRPRRRPARRRLVAAGGHLPDLPALVGRRRRRRHRRPARHHVAARPPARARRRRHLALALLHLPAGRRGLRRRRLPRRRPDLRHPRGRRRHDRARPRARPQGDRRHGAQPLAPTSTSGSRRPSPPVPARPSASATCSARGAASTASCPRTTGSPSSAAPPGPASPRPTAARASGTCTSSTRSSPTSTGSTPRCAPSSSRSCASGSTGASTASASTSRTASSRSRACPTPRRSARRCSATPSTTHDTTPRGRAGRRPRGSTTRSAAPCGTRTASTRSTARGAGSSSPTARPDRILCAEAWVEPQERAVKYVRSDEMHQAFNFDFLTASWIAEDLQRGHHLVAASRRLGRRTVDVGAVQPRRRAPRVAPRLRARHAADERHLGDRPAARPRARPAPGPGGHGAHARAARRRVHLPGRGARPARLDRHAGRVPPGPDLRAHRTAPRPAATAAASRSRGRPTGPSLGFGPSASTWLPQPDVYADYAVDRQVGRGRARPSSSTARSSPRRRELSLGDRLAHVGRGVCRRRRRADQRLVRSVAGSSSSRTSAPTPSRCPRAPRSSWPPAPLEDGLVPTDTTVWARWS